MQNYLPAEKWQYLDPPRKVPDFSLTCVRTGEQLSIKDFQSQRVILTYLPGVWSPWCRKFLSFLQDNLELFSQSKYSVILMAIISQDYDGLYEYQLEAEQGFDILSDSTGAIGRRFGVFDDNASEPIKISKPSVFILDEHNFVRCKFIGDHLADKPDPLELLQRVDEDFKPLSEENISASPSVLNVLKKLL